MLDLCLFCESYPGDIACTRCVWGNPCLGCEDYDFEENTCRSNGGCATRSAAEGGRL